MLKATEIGIDLGRYEIKIAQVQEVDELNHLKEYESYDVNSEMYSKDYFNTLRSAIKDFSKKIKKSKLSLNFVLPSNEHTNTVFMNVPAVSDKDLEAGVKFELDQMFAGQKVDDYKYIWKVVNEYEELNEYEILLATLSSEVIKAFSKFKTINWKVNRIMLQPILLERFAKENDIIVDFGYKESRVYMYKEGKLSETQTINIGSYDVETLVESHIEENHIDSDIDIKEIMSNLYIENEFLETDELTNDLSLAISPTISKLIEELKRNVRSFELQNGLNIDNIYYMGGLFNLNHLDMKLGAELDAEVKPLNILAKDIDSNKYDLAGLAMISPEVKDTMDFSKYLKANVDYTSILVGILAVAVSVSIAFGAMDSKYEEVLEEQRGTEAQQSQVLSGLNDDIARTQQSIRNDEEFIDKIDRITNYRQWLSDALFVLPDLTPLSIGITDLTIRDKVVTIEGYSADYSAIGFFAKKLEEYGEVDIESITDLGETPTIYSVITDTPETISDKYLMSRQFRIVLNHEQKLIER